MASDKPSKGMMKEIRLLVIYMAALLLGSCEAKQEMEAPLVLTGEVIMESDTSAVMQAKITNFGTSPIVESGFVWGLDSSFNSSIKVKNERNDKAVYTGETNVKLLPGRTYYVKAYVQSDQFISYGRTVSFDSPPGPVHQGKWTKVTGNEQGFGWCIFVSSIFTIDQTSYFILERGEMYSYDHTTNTFRLLIKNTILQYANCSFVVQDNVYILSQNTMYLFDPRTKLFTMLSSYPRPEVSLWRTGFRKGDDLYVGLGSMLQGKYSKDFWKFNIPTNTWKQTASFPGDFRSGAFSFSLHGKGYVGGGFNLIEPQWPYPKFNDLWCYSPENDQWEQKASLPIQNIEEIYGLLGVTIGDYGYCFYENELYEYHPLFDIWQKMADLDIKRRLCWPNMFAAYGKLFVVEMKESDNVKSLIMWAYEK